MRKLINKVKSKERSAKEGDSGSFGSFSSLEEKDEHSLTNPFLMEETAIDGLEKKLKLVIRTLGVPDLKDEEYEKVIPILNQTMLETEKYLQCVSTKKHKDQDQLSTKAKNLINAITQVKEFDELLSKLKSYPSKLSFKNIEEHQIALFKLEQQFREITPNDLIIDSINTLLDVLEKKFTYLEKNIKTFKNFIVLKEKLEEIVESIKSKTLTEDIINLNNEVFLSVKKESEVLIKEIISINQLSESISYINTFQKTIENVEKELSLLNMLLRIKYEMEALKYELMSEVEPNQEKFVKTSEKISEALEQIEKESSETNSSFYSNALQIKSEIISESNRLKKDADMLIEILKLEEDLLPHYRKQFSNPIINELEKLKLALAKSIELANKKSTVLYNKEFNLFVEQVISRMRRLQQEIISLLNLNQYKNELKYIENRLNENQMSMANLNELLSLSDQLEKKTKILKESTRNNQLSTETETLLKAIDAISIIIKDQQWALVEMSAVKTQFQNLKKAINAKNFTINVFTEEMFKLIQRLEFSKKKISTQSLLDDLINLIDELAQYGADIITAFDEKKSKSTPNEESKRQTKYVDIGFRMNSSPLISKSVDQKPSNALVKQPSENNHGGRKMLTEIVDIISNYERNKEIQSIKSNIDIISQISTIINTLERETIILNIQKKAKIMEELKVLLLNEKNSFTMLVPYVADSKSAADQKNLNDAIAVIEEYISTYSLRIIRANTLLDIFQKSISTVELFDSIDKQKNSASSDYPTLLLKELLIILQSINTSNSLWNEFIQELKSKFDTLRSDFLINITDDMLKFESLTIENNPIASDSTKKDNKANSLVAQRLQFFQSHQNQSKLSTVPKSTVKRHKKPITMADLNPPGDDFPEMHFKR